MFNVCISVLNTGAELITIEKHMQERVAQVFFVIFSTVLHCAELGRHVRQQAHVSKPRKRTTMIEQKMNTDECDGYVYSKNGQQIQPVRRTVVSAKGLVQILKDKKNVSGCAWSVWHFLLQLVFWWN
jgi:hypothetical protein